MQGAEEAVKEALSIDVGAESEMQRLRRAGSLCLCSSLRCSVPFLTFWG